MTALRKITVEVPEATLRAAMQGTGEGVTETVRRALEALATQQAYRDFRALRGKIRFEHTWQELRGKDDDE